MASTEAGPTSGRGSTRYRGRLGTWSWAANRIAAVLTFFFLFVHVLDTALVRISPDQYDRVIGTYQNPIVNLMEVVLVGAVLYHALDGLRLMLLDVLTASERGQRVLHLVVLVVWLLAMLPIGYFLLRYNAERLFGAS